MSELACRAWRRARCVPAALGAVAAIAMGCLALCGMVAAPAPAATTAHDPLAIIVTGDQVQAPSSMTTYSGDAYWLTKAEVAALKGSRGLLDPHGDLWASRWYSWCENHGTPVYGWTRAAGIGLKELLSDAGLSAAQIASLRAVTVAASPEADAFSYAIDLGLPRYRFTATDATSGEPVDPLLALYFDDADTHASLPAEATTPVEGPFTTLVSGQTTTAESNRCGFVTDASLVSLTESSPAFVIDAPDAYAAGDRQKTNHTLAALIGDGNLQRVYTVAGAVITCDGSDLHTLLAGARGAIDGQDKVLFTTLSGTVDPGLCVADIESGEYLLAYYSENQAGAAVTNGTQVMVYGDGVAVADVLSLRVEDVEPTAGLTLTSPTASQSKASVPVRGKLALRAVAVPARGATAAGPVTWTSSAPSVATVDAAGTVTARRTGRAVVTVASESYSRTFTVSVVARKKNATRVTLPKTKATSAGSTLCLAARVAPSASTSTISWKSSNGAVATVGRGGTISALKKGKTTITVRTNNGRTARCVLTVR